jgi:acetolactate synthase-1/2/3 large subunit
MRVADGTVTEALVARLRARGVTRLFGVPGGECNLDFIAAAEAAGIPFVLTRTETAAAIMACVTGELTGAPGVAMTTRGPGLAAAANGVAYADLDRASLLLIADGYEDEQVYISHQRIDQAGLLAPMLRAASDARFGAPVEELDRLLAAAESRPRGPAYLEVSGSRIRRPADTMPPPAPILPLPAPDPDKLDEARRMIAAARRPLLIAGLQARSAAAGDALRDFVVRTGCPALTTYKAKGVVSERSPLGLGLYAGGVAEEPAIRSADLILLYGFDPVEGPPQRWRYAGTPTVELTEHPHAHTLVDSDVVLVADLPTTLAALAPDMPPPGWNGAELAAIKDRLWSAARTPIGQGIAPSQLVDAAIAALPADSRITIDAGAHMLPVLHLWQAPGPNLSLISRGLSTMGFALPAAIAASLAEPDRRTVAFTGDGGLMMCMGELGTAVQSGARPLVVVFNDSSLTLIAEKQKRRQMGAAGVDFTATDFAQAAAAFGWFSIRVDEAADLPAAFAAALAAPGPVLIDVVIAPFQYEAQITAIRG